MSDVQPLKDIAARFFATFSSGDMAGVVDMLEDGATWTVCGRLAGVSGRYSKAQMAALLPATKALYREPGLRITPQRMIAEGDSVAVEAEGQGTLADGRPYEPSYYFRLTIRDGALAEVREFMDTAHAQELFFPG